VKSPRLVAALVLLALVTIVVLQNTAVVETRLFFATISMPTAFLLLGTLAIGMLIGFLLGARFQRKRNRAA